MESTAIAMERPLYPRDAADFLRDCSDAELAVLVDALAQELHDRGAVDTFCGQARGWLDRIQRRLLVRRTETGGYRPRVRP